MALWHSYLTLITKYNFLVRNFFIKREKNKLAAITLIKLKEIFQIRYHVTK